MTTDGTPIDDGLSPEEIRRYSRHLTLPDVGLEGQLRLRDASVVLIGAGGLGAPLALYLAAAGVGRIGLVDFDKVDLSNLQRQVLYGTGDVGCSKARRARDRIAEINPHVTVDVHEERLDPDNARGLLGPYDVVVDGTDNFPTRYLVNDACAMLGKPDVYGSIFRFEGQVSVFHAAEGPCYRCLYPEPPEPGSVPNCAEGGVLGILPGIIGTIQATEAIKWILQKGESLLGRLLLFDALEMRFRELRLRKDPDCPVCGRFPTITTLEETAASCAAPAASARPAAFPELDVRTLGERLRAGSAPLLLDVRTEEERRIVRLDDAAWIPVQELSRRWRELEAVRDREIVVYCHVGGRSAMATHFLLERGFRDVKNLAGGIDAWAEQVEPGMPRY